VLIISQEAFDEMATLRRIQREVPFIVQTIRERGDPLAQSLSDEILRREVRATLDVAEGLELTSDVDRLTFCMLEITSFAGLREVPKLSGLLNYAQGPADARIEALLAKMPPPVWLQLSQGASEVQARRGWV
jgi:hypothetical protein